MAEVTCLTGPLKNEGETVSLIWLTFVFEFPKFLIVHCYALYQTQFIVSGSLDQTLRVWNINGEKVHEHDCGKYGGVTALSFIEKTPAGPVLLVGLEDGTVQVRDFPGFSLAFELNSRVCKQL